MCVCTHICMNIHLKTYKDTCVYKNLYTQICKYEKETDFMISFVWICMVCGYAHVCAGTEAGG